MSADARALTVLGDIAFLTGSFWPKVNKSGECWQWMGGKTPNGYGHVNVWTGNRKTTAATHRVSYELANGEIPNGMEIDHVCHNRGCVKPDHLRVVTHKQNLENLSGLSARNTSGFRGVTWSKQAGKWLARVTHNGRSIFAGSFDDPKEAGAAAAAKRLELFTHNDQDRRAA